ncbi:hypothetical protein LHFGNBLO_002562 [Mesorhizobium sp. AR10]|uniref:hypothetical protein n=1 Tax=Mesorhizobium sp. AR10 TaxID=2865839 RepID=UPI002160542F|nr:hypothetical protein [Mesorhizobium sp. AR10]UVK41017.1 hypothetical protein LHFGNBLO_002562 [Mesorhizobium sp. AR10]
MGRTVNLAGSATDCRRDVCPSVNGWDEAFKILVPFMKEGVERGDKPCKSSIGANRRTASAAGIDVQPETGLTRLWANMEWARQDFPGVHHCPEHESRLDVLPLHELPLYEMATICTCGLTLIVDWAPPLRDFGRHRARESVSMCRLRKLIA